MSHFIGSISAIVALFLVTLPLSAQPFQQLLFPGLIVGKEGPLENSFTGGIETPVFQMLDFDGDGKQDLFILDRDGRLAWYKDAGTSGVPSFRLTSFHFQSLSVGSWFRFVDIDADGDLDLFCSGTAPSTVTFYRNRGSQAQPNFLLEVDGVKDVNNNVVLSEEISIPTFADMDGDGDLDFFSGNSVGSIWYYENVGTPQEFRFRFVTQQYQGIVIVGAGGVAGKENETGSTSMLSGNRLHGAMAISFGDLDGDGDLDLVWGDFFNRSLYRLRNIGNRTHPQLVLSDSTYPKESPVFTSGFNMPQLVDVDRDGRIDLLVGVLYPGESRDNFLFYRNTGTAAQHHFVLETKNLVPTLDVGAASSPVFADVDGDGKPDLVIGSETGRLAYYRRVFARGWVFEHVTDTLVSLSGLFNVRPAFGDLDGDGKPEMILGDANGRLRLFRDRGGYTEDTSFTLRTFSFGQNAAPVLADVDGDGRFDLFVGTGGGRLHYFSNKGTAANPVFELQSAFFDSIDVGDDAVPTFADLDGDGDLDLIIGARDGRLSYYQNRGTRTSFRFVKVEDLFAGVAHAPRSAPAFLDVDDDQDLDLFLGNIKGGLYFYRNERVPLAAPSDPASVEFELLQNYPNPFNPMTTIEFRLAVELDVRISIYDLLGREVRKLVEGRRGAGLHQVQWDASGYAGGLYVVRLSAGALMQSKKLIFLR
jgi:hypothetical protein